ncbi:twin-arginine translocation pathway signal protein [Stappia sp. GBMRC 2046]|uniref:Twin-arginine translocation pathway signal protein n=2 Tax=Stappia sediminis TaxID=2692190 RepID=A0A7X3LUM5_9HYPH|nr:twin-arginine translocation pathway signal protein [Stappia sediminis]
MAEGLDYAVEPSTGYALSGHDPLSYFIGGRPRSGDPSIEYRWDGAVWVFVNEGNRDAFVTDPDVYAPQFTGCDPQALAEGYATTGNPMIFAIIDSRLYLFHSEVNRFLFLSNPSLLLEDARANARTFNCWRG